ncbi:uncharacterized protein LOC109985990 [Xyrichtys novacula]|uniref:Uncharacterized protein LOC109985990 n=1 Tax=Xyrichtys novacula TaxID=13765 RepID=A0AAV1F433_XYRNO|nr:uncharacterized protein LOC109985990 [Xyrichtys novacula]
MRSQAGREAAVEEEEVEEEVEEGVKELLLQQRPGAPHGETRELSSSNGETKAAKEEHGGILVDPAASAVGASRCAHEKRKKEGTPQFGCFHRGAHRVKRRHTQRDRPSFSKKDRKTDRTPRYPSAVTRSWFWWFKGQSEIPP